MAPQSHSARVQGGIEPSSGSGAEGEMQERIPPPRAEL